MRPFDARLTVRRGRGRGGATLGFDSKAWDMVSVAVMEAGLEQQLRANPVLAATLLTTGNAFLAEAARTDSTWGIGMDAENAARAPRSAWGRNLHGRVMMRQRAALRTAPQ